MSEISSNSRERDLRGQATEIAIRLAVIGLIAAWCFAIFKPFLMPLVWGAVLAVALRPAFVFVERLVGGRRKTAAAILIVLALAAILVPTFLLSGSMIDGVRMVSEQVDTGEVPIPRAPERVAQWPVIGSTVYETWNLASTNLEAALQKFKPQVRAFGKWLIRLAKSGAMAVLFTAVAIVIAGVFVVNREGAGRAAIAVGHRIGGEAGAESVRLAAQTIGTVAKGVVGVAAIQAGLAAIGLVIAGIPGAGLWSLIILVLAVAQLPPLLVLVPAIIYLVAKDASMTTIVLFSIWSVVVTISDGLLKPLLLGRGSDTPVLVILIGAIGGLILHGLIGLFVGAVVFTTGFRLFKRWMAQSSAGVTASSAG